MSLSQMQAALAMIVRYPTAPDIDAMLDGFELSSGERNALAQLSQDRELAKFGAGLEDMRWEMINVRLPLVVKCVGMEALFDIYTFGFNPVSTNIPNRELPYEFLCFLEQDEQARELLGATKPWVWDLVAFEKAQLRILMDRWEAPPAPSLSSPLVTRAIYLCELTHDLPTYLLGLERGEEPVPVPGTTRVLLLPDEGPIGYRLFLLEPDTFAFLEAALNDRGAKLPANYHELVTAGLCHPPLGGGSRAAI